MPVDVKPPKPVGIMVRAFSRVKIGLKKFGKWVKSWIGLK